MQELISFYKDNNAANCFVVDFLKVENGEIFHLNIFP